MLNKIMDMIKLVNIKDGVIIMQVKGLEVARDTLQNAQDKINNGGVKFRIGGVIIILLLPNKINILKNGKDYTINTKNDLQNIIDNLNEVIKIIKQ